MLTQLLKQKRVILILGSGGVGKTTTSIGIALAAARQGKKVALLSIDPAKRLASALGIALGSDLSPVQNSALLRGTGSLHAAMLDQKAVFDQLVDKFAVSAKVAASIKNNRLYQAVSSSLGGPLEYLALAKLALVDESEKFDVIVVDTPPDTHALDFLQRPDLLSGFVDNKVMTWLLKPFLMAKRFGLTKIFSMGEKLMGSIAAVTGVQALETLAEFLVLIQDVIDGFHRSGKRVVEMLRRPTTGLILIGTPTAASTRSMEAMAEDLKKMEYKVSGVIINRGMPRAVADELTQKNTSIDVSKMAYALNSLRTRLAEEERVCRNLIKRIEGQGDSVAVFRLEELTVDMQSIDGLLAFIRALEE